MPSPRTDFFRLRTEPATLSTPLRSKGVEGVGGGVRATGDGSASGSTHRRWVGVVQVLTLPQAG
jgi:hypothetical protein